MGVAQVVTRAISVALMQSHARDDRVDKGRRYLLSQQPLLDRTRGPRRPGPGLIPVTTGHRDHSAVRERRRGGPLGDPLDPSVGRCRLERRFCSDQIG